MSKSLLEIKVDCPYEPVGSATIVGTQDSQGTVQVPGINDPVKCNFCSRFFFIRPRVVFEGVKAEEPIIVRRSSKVKEASCLMN